MEWEREEKCFFPDSLTEKYKEEEIISSAVTILHKVQIQVYYIYNYLDSWIFQKFLIYFNITRIIQDDLLISHMSIPGCDVNEQTLSNHISSVFIIAFIKPE